LIRGADVNGSFTRLRDGNTDLSAPLNLPDGAVITGVTVYFLDATQSANLNFTIYSQSNADGGDFTLAFGNSAGSSFFYRSLQLQTNFSTISNSTRSYYMTVEPAVGDWSDALRLRSVKIEYTVSGPD
jgi:hypothetical protein